MVESGHEVRVFASELNDSLRTELLGLGVEVCTYSLSRAGMNPREDYQTYLFLKRELTAYHPDKLFSYNLKPVVYSSLAARRIVGLESWSLVTGLGHIFVDQTPRAKLLKALITPLYRAALKANKGYFFQNSDDLSELESGRIAEPQKATVVSGSGVDLALYRREALPAETGRFLFVGRFLKEKGIHDLVTAFAEVKTAYPQSSLKLVGATDANPSSLTEEDVSDLVRTGVVDNLGWLDDVRPAIQESSVMVLPSYREGTPRSVLEAMAMGRAIITTDVPGCRETVVHGVNGLLVPVRDPKALAAAMSQLAADPELVSKMGEASYQIAKDKYDVHKVNDVMLRTMGLRE